MWALVEFEMRLRSHSRLQVHKVLGYECDGVRVIDASQKCVISGDRGRDSCCTQRDFAVEMALVRIVRRCTG